MIDSLVYIESLEDSRFRSVAGGTDGTEKPGGSDVLRLEGPVTPSAPARIVGAGVHGVGARAGRGGRGGSHDSSLRKSPFISTIDGAPRALLPLPLLYLFKHLLSRAD